MEKITTAVIEEFEALATNLLQVCKEMKKQYVKTKTKIKGKMSQDNAEKGDANNKMQKGSICYRPKEKRYICRYWEGKKQICFYAKTKKEGQELLKQRIAEYYERIKSNNYMDSVIDKTKSTTKNDNACKSKTMTLNSWFEYWVNTFKKQEVKESTYNQYLEIYSRYTTASLGLKKVNEITSTDLQEHINNIPAYSGQKKTKQILNDLFDILQKQNYIKTNPMLLVVLPKKNIDDAPDVEESIEILAYKDEQTLLSYLSLGKNKNKYYYPIKLILYSGLRRGEMLGLQWKHIDFENETISIKQQYNINTSKITSVKSKAGNRVIPMLPQAKEILLELYQNNNIDQDSFIFEDCRGITQRLCDYSNRLGFQINPHMLRHTFASRCYAAGVDPKRIQTLLGHESVDTTLNTYTHVLEQDELEIIKQMRDVFIAKGIILTL